MASPEVEFCSHCFTLFQSLRDDVEWPKLWAHYRTYSQLSASSMTCFLCQLFVASLLPTLKRSEDASLNFDEYPFKLNVVSARKMPSNITWMFLDVSLNSLNTIYSYMKELTILVRRDKDYEPSTHIWNSSSVSIEDSTSTIASWFHQCYTNHAHIDDRWRQSRPKRLLSVGLDEKPMRLVLSNTIASTTQYATLSYCWGQSPRLKSTKNSIKEFEEAVPAELLPATYSEFIKIARALAIPYVWIDALCIIQDDEDEWQHEAARMGDIFQGSVLTIAAAQSSDTSAGCFPVTEQADPSNGALLRVRQQQTEKPDILARIYKGDFRSSVEDSIISGRGWTLQEQLLSPRIVYCMGNDVHWQCQTCFRTQTGLEFNAAEAFAFNLQILAPFANPTVEEYRQSYANIWYRIVINYGKRLFTYKTDRVPAIAGIMKHMASVLNDTPILGLWKRTFGRDLAWIAPSGGTRHEIAERMGLPSWTWLGFQGGFSYTLWSTDKPGVLQIQHTELLDWDIKWAGVDNASAVQCARIRIKGPVRDIPLSSFDAGQKHTPPYLYAFGESIDHINKTSIPWRCCGELDDGTRMKPSTYFCMLLWSYHQSPDRIEEIFLILENVHNSDIPIFRRIGLGRIWGSERTFDINNEISISLV
ncbi:HET-domain-containing protein [Xylaria scruposa]|nr:HET-domain-containing protein [Xylaria scruposa]